MDCGGLGSKQRKARRERPGIGEICQLAATVAEVSIEIFLLLEQQR